MQNNRIKELMSLASTVRVSGFGDTEILNPEMFAKLIVNEARMLLCNEAFQLGDSTESRAILAASSKVKEHFGVE